MSQKVNLNSVREETRKKVAKQYVEKISYLEDQIRNLRVKCNDAYCENRRLREENEELQEKIRVYEDWNERLQDFVNMGEEDRDRAMKKYRTEAEVNEAMKRLLDAPFMKYFYEIL